MSELTKQQLTVENNSSFPNNNTGFITPTLLRTFNQDMIDSMVDEVTYNADSASWTSDILALEQFSASLSTNFVTPTELSASSSTLQNNINTKLNTSSFNAYTASQEVISASFNTRINSVTGSSGNTGSLLLTASAVSNVITFTKGDGSTFPVTVGSVIDSSSLVSTSSFNQYTQSAASGVSASINAATSSLSASIAVTDLAQSSSIAQLLGFSSSLDATFATDAQLSASASTLQDDINRRLLTSSFNTYTQSISTQIAGLGNQLNAKLNTSSFNSYTSSNDGKVNALIAATGSYITSAQTSSMTVLSASFALTASQARNVVVIARNGNPSSLPGGTVVRITGASGDNPIFNTASFVDETQSGNTLGILRNSLASGQDGEVVVNGIVLGVDTDPALGYVAGDIVYLSSSGQFTRIQPQAPENIVVLGEVLRAQQNNGSIYVNISNGWELNELHNVRITNPQNGQTLVYSSSLWINSSSAATVNTGSLLTTASISGDTITFTKGDGSTFPIVVPSGGSGSVDTGSFATTGSNTFKDTQNIDLSGGTNTGAIAIIGTSEGAVIDMYANGGNYDTFNVLVSASNGVFLRDYNGVATVPFLSVDTNGGNVRIPRSTNITGSLNVSASLGGDDGNLIRGGVTIVGNNLGNAISVMSGSVSVTSPQGAGFFYSNLPITSSGLRINGTALVNDLIVSGVFGGNSSVNVIGALTASVISASTYIGIPTGSFATTGSNRFVGNQTITGSLTLSSSAAIELNVIGDTIVSGTLALTGSSPTHTFLSGGINYSGSIVSTATDTFPSAPQGNFIVTLSSASMATLLSTNATNANTLYFVI